MVAFRGNVARGSRSFKTGSQPLWQRVAYSLTLFTIWYWNDDQGAKGCSMADGRPTDGDRRSGLESTASIFHRAQGGDSHATNELFGRYLPVLLRWARGRLPAHSRRLQETDDLVQMTLTKALDKVRGFEVRREGAFLAYLRTILLNQVREEIRNTRRRPQTVPLPRDLEAPAALSPLERAVGAEGIEHYETALASLPAEQAEAVFLKVEMGFTNAEIAEALGKPSPNAARMLVARSLVRIAEAISREQ